MEAFEVFANETLDELLRWLVELRQTLDDIKNGFDRLLGSLAAEEDAASADSFTRLGRGERSRSICGYRVFSVTKTHAPYL